MPKFNNGESAASVRQKINDAIDKVDGVQAISDADITGGTIDNTVIGGVTPVAGTFTNLTANTDLTINSTTTVTAILDEDNMASDSATALATQQSIKAYVDAQVTAQDLDFAGDSGTGAIDLDSQVFTVAGTANQITTVASGQNITISLPATISTTTADLTNIEVTNIKAKDGTAAATIADATGVVTIPSAVLTTADINGGTIDGATIGGTTPAAGTFSTATVNGNITVTGTVDGRDVAADGTKLDTVETNADVTDTANVTAAGAVMDSELTNEAAVKALDQGVATTDSPTFAATTINGNITVTGTVDGRNVAEDGTKLDGIEAGADVTDPTNVQAAGALMDSELTSEASVKALNQGVATTDSPSFAGLTVDTNTLYVDSTNNRVGVNTSSPAQALHVVGATQLQGDVIFNDTDFRIYASTSDGADTSRIALLSGGAFSSTRGAYIFACGNEHATDAGNVVIASGTAATGRVQINGLESIRLVTGSSEALRVYSNNDIAFFEDTGTTPKFFWDASAERLGIGTSSPAASLHISSSLPEIRLTDTDTGAYAEILNNNSTLSLRADENNTAGSSFIDMRVDGSERLRITSGGSVLVGKSVTTFNTTGMQIDGPNGNFSITASGATTAFFNRTSTDGDIAAFYKDGTKVGSIGGYSGDMSIGNGDTGLIFDDANDVIRAFNTSTGASRDAAVSLGQSNIRFKDLYLSGSAIIDDGAGRLTLDAASGVNYLYSTTTGFAAYEDLAIVGDNLIFRNGATERMRIDSSGNVLVGTTTGGKFSVSYGGLDTHFGFGANYDNYITQGPSGATFFRNNTTTHMSITPTGSVGIGTSSPSSLLHVNGSTTLGGNVLVGGQLQSLAGAATYIDFGTAGQLSINTAGSERMRITSTGDVLLGTTTRAGHLTLDKAYGGGTAVSLNTTNTGTAYTGMAFRQGGTLVGFISVGASSTVYATSSDYRLKENVTTLDGAAYRLEQIPVHRFNFIADPDTTVDGFLAHEVQEIVPEAVTGEKDAVDADGNPVYQGIDQSKLVPLLTAALQEALQKIDALEARVATLEAN